MCGVYPVFKKLSNSFCFKFLKHLENSELLIFNTANWKYSASKIIPDFFLLRIIFTSQGRNSIFKVRGIIFVQISVEIVSWGYRILLPMIP